MIGLRTTTGTSAVSRVFKSASEAAVGNSTGIGKRVNHCEDNKSESGDPVVGVEPG